MLLNAVFFICLASLALSILLLQYKDEIRGTIDQLTSGKYEEKNSMLQKSEDGTSIKNSTSLSNNNHRENELLLAVYIDNFFENSDIPNPLYLTSFYYAKFDTATETFEIADDMPDKDLFRPDPGRIPLYQTVTDSSVLAFTGEQPGLKTVEIEVYNKGMTFADFVAPTTAFSVQPIAVDIAYQKEYKSAYIARSMVSELNSAYFVYNVSNPEAVKFQNARYDILRNVQHFGKMDSAAYAYYTELPDIESLREVRDLAYQVAGNKDLPIDKIIAVKDFFLSKDANGRPRFQYSDNPGIPDIPSAKNLNYFLFENRKGFCAHYAGATLFLLRSLGIPSRITAGFLVEDRSTTNPGWYYLYADQVHAWVQVYFPGYGWLDFDTTVGNDEARESDQPDATPPLEPKKATLTFSGYISSIDTSRKTVNIQAQSATFYDQNFNTEQAIAVSLDISISRIVRDTSTLSIYDLSINDTVAAVSYTKNHAPTISKAEDMRSLADLLAEPVPTDLLQVMSKLIPSRQHPDDFRKLNKFKWKWVSYPLLGLLVLFFPGSPDSCFDKKIFQYPDQK
ncbi:MAG: transglutaminase-like domain-containing protein [Taibaiella sp.]|nr:transglutaminase-like domain-containing protein [Taibaiella sp.]